MRFEGIVPTPRSSSNTLNQKHALLHYNEYDSTVSLNFVVKVPREKLRVGRLAAVALLRPSSADLVGPKPVRYLSHLQNQDGGNTVNKR